MRTKEDKLVHRHIIVNIQCDVCGKSCRKNTSDSYEYEYEYATLFVDWGYYSDSDGKSYNIELCEECFYDTLAHLKLRCKTDGQNLNPKEYYGSIHNN